MLELTAKIAAELCQRKKTELSLWLSGSCGSCFYFRNSYLSRQNSKFCLFKLGMVKISLQIVGRSMQFVSTRLSGWFFRWAPTVTLWVTDCASGGTDVNVCLRGPNEHKFYCVYLCAVWSAVGISFAFSALCYQLFCRRREIYASVLWRQTAVALCLTFPVTETTCSRETNS